MVDKCLLTVHDWLMMRNERSMLVDGWWWLLAVESKACDWCPAVGSPSLSMVSCGYPDGLWRCLGAQGDSQPRATGHVRGVSMVIWPWDFPIWRGFGQHLSARSHGHHWWLILVDCMGGLSLVADNLWLCRAALSRLRGFPSGCCLYPPTVFLLGTRWLLNLWLNTINLWFWHINHN